VPSLYRLVAGLAAVVAGGVLVGSCSAGYAAPVPASCTVARPAAAPGSRHPAAAPHIMVVVLENESYSQLIGNSAAPYINSLARHYLRATCSYAHAHDSLPNYLELVSGRAYEASGTPVDCTPPDCGPIAGRNIGGQLTAAGIRWRAVMGAMPANCDPSNAGGPGGYGVRHNPFVYFHPGRASPECTNDVPSSGLLRALDARRPPGFVFYSPAICHDGGYDAACSTIAASDRFLQRRIRQIMATPWYRAAGTIILTWDEGTQNDISGKFGDRGGHVLTVVISAGVKGDGAYHGYVDSAGILRTIEHAYGLGYLGAASDPRSGMLPLGRH
jgi:acid phosphatase